MKKILLLSLLIILGISLANQVAFAESAVLSVSPASANASTGSIINVSLKLNPTSNKVCVVKGTLNFDKLACQNITVASGVMAQITPTCISPSFMLGIPQCSTTERNILSLSVKGTAPGQANLTVTGVKLIGAGADVAFVAGAGVYNINEVQAAATQSQQSGASGQQSLTQGGQRNMPAGAGEQVVADDENANEQLADESSLADQPASMADTKLPSNIIILIILVILVIGGAWYMLSKKKKK